MTVAVAVRPVTRLIVAEIRRQLNPLPLVKSLDAGRDLAQMLRAVFSFRHCLFSIWAGPGSTQELTCLKSNAEVIQMGTGSCDNNPLLKSRSSARWRKYGLDFHRNSPLASEHSVLRVGLWFQ